MAEQFDDLLLDEFAHKFYGYGNYGGQFWFIGMEEGCWWRLIRGGRQEA